MLAHDTIPLGFRFGLLQTEAHVKVIFRLILMVFCSAPPPNHVIKSARWWVQIFCSWPPWVVWMQRNMKRPYAMWRVHRLQFSTYRKVVAEKWMKKACMSHVLLFFFTQILDNITHFCGIFADKCFETMLSTYENESYLYVSYEKRWTNSRWRCHWKCPTSVTMMERARYVARGQNENKKMSVSPSIRQMIFGQPKA